MPNTPSAHRLWPQHVLSEPSHALGLPSSHTRQPSEDAPAALSEPRHTLGLPLSYKRSPLQASYAMPSACLVMPDAIHVCPMSSMPYAMASLDRLDPRAMPMPASASTNVPPLELLRISRYLPCLSPSLGIPLEPRTSPQPCTDFLGL